MAYAMVHRHFARERLRFSGIWLIATLLMNPALFVSFAILRCPDVQRENGSWTSVRYTKLHTCNNFDGKCLYLYQLYSLTCTCTLPTSASGYMFVDCSRKTATILSLLYLSIDFYTHTHMHMQVWRYDGTVECYTEGHLPLAIWAYIVLAIYMLFSLLVPGFTYALLAVVSAQLK